MLVVLVVSEIRKSIACLMCSESSNVAIGSILNHFSVKLLFFQPATSSSGNGRPTTWAIATRQQGGTVWKCYL